MMTSLKLFTVIALAGAGGTAFADNAPRTLKNGRPAAGNVVRSRGKGGAKAMADDPFDGVETTLAAKPVVAKPTVAQAMRAAVRSRVTTVVAARATTPTTNPRTLANGSPACGNVADKSPMPCQAAK